MPPEALADTLHPGDTLFVLCRSPAQRLVARAGTIRAHGDAGGTVVAMGENRSDIWLPGVAFTPRPTNGGWWREPGADLGVEIAAAGGGARPRRRHLAPGRTVVTRLDPCYHHGSHFMPATTRFLAGFLPALRALATGEAA